MRLRVLGSNGTYPTPGRACSGYLVEAGGTVVMLDAGHGTAAVLQEAGAASRLTAIVLTHGHPDHCADVFALLNLYRMGPEPRSGITLLAPAGVAEAVAGFIGAGPDHGIHRVFEWRQTAPGDTTLLGEITLRFGRAEHSVAALVVALEADGRRLVYSGDTGPGGDLPSLAAAADLLLCDATLQGPVGGGARPDHLSAAEAGALARAAGVRRLYLTHLAPKLDPAVSIAEAAAAFSGPVAWASPGLEVEV